MAARFRSPARRAAPSVTDRHPPRVAIPLPGADVEERRRNARLLISGMSGTMMIARAVNDPQLSNQILAQAREFYISAFESPARG